MKQVFSPRFQRIASVIFIILIQIIFFLVIIYQFQNYFFYFYWICMIISVLASLWVANARAKLAYKIAWIVPILLFPVLGGPIFFLLGGSRRASGEDIQRSKESFQTELFSACQPKNLRFLGTAAVQQAHYLQHAAHCPVYTQTESRYFSSGESLFPVLLRELEQAQHYIFLEYFIIAEGEMWSAILDILTQKAAAGVDVRVIYDDLGSVTTLPHHYHKDLERLGIRCGVFRPVRPVLSIHQNNRDHRKICVIDGITGFCGGINLSDEYINHVARFGYWRDSAILLRGAAVWSLSVMFLNMWESIHREVVEYQNFRPDAVPVSLEDNGFIQPYMDTPLPTDTVCADLHLQMFSKAKHYLYITTPYLIIDETIASALCVAAKTGVDVRIMTPHIPDKKAIFSVTQSYYEPLIRAGIRIYEFLPGFNHSKTVVADDLYASVGSCNLDYRSFYLQFENGVWLCGSTSVLDIRDDFLRSLALCQEITLDDCKNIPLPKRLSRSILRMLSPIF